MELFTSVNYTLQNSSQIIKKVQYHAFFSIQSDNTVEAKILRKINLLRHSGHLDKKK